MNSENKLFCPLNALNFKLSKGLRLHLGKNYENYI